MYYFSDTSYTLDHFEIAQTFPTQSSKVMHFYFNDSSEVVDILALLDNITHNINFYVWQPDSKEFIQTRGKFFVK